MLSTILNMLIAAFGKVIAEVLQDRRQSASLKDLGRAEASSETLVIFAEKADAQAQVNATDRGGARDVARRLRERLAKSGTH